MEGYIYLDNNATTEALPQVIEEVSTALSFHCNPSSPHGLGVNCRYLLESARATIEDILLADPGTIVFTSGATESNNLVLQGTLLPKLLQGQKPRLVTTVVEHSSVLKTARYLEDLGVEVVLLDIDSCGQVQMADLEQVLPADLVSIQWANSETGILQPIKELAGVCRKKETSFHTDAAQSIGKLNLSVDEIPVDFLSFTGHKFHAPPGVGGLYVRQRDHLSSILKGGDQEFALRPGTENLPAILGMARALEIRYQDLERITSHLAALRNRLEHNLTSRLPVRIIANDSKRTCNVTNILFPEVDGQSLVSCLSQHGVYCSQTSACIASRPEPSYVLRAMGLSEEEAWRCVRFSVSVLNQEEEIERASEIIVECYQHLREKSK